MRRGYLCRGPPGGDRQTGDHRLCLHRIADGYKVLAMGSLDTTIVLLVPVGVHAGRGGHWKG